MIYSSIINSNTIIADYSENSGDFNIITLKILKANRQPIQFYVIPYQNYEFYFLQDEPYVFSCIVNVNTDNEKVLIFLQSLKEKFFSLCKNEKDNLTLKSTNLIRDLMNSHSDIIQDDKFNKIESQLEVIKNEKANIIQETLNKELILDSIFSKSENLMKAFQINKKLEKVKSSSLKFYLIGFISLIIILIILYYKYFSDFKIIENRIGNANINKEKKNINYDKAITI